jgi:hypothetical protein
VEVKKTKIGILNDRYSLVEEGQAIVGRAHKAILSGGIEAGNGNRAVPQRQDSTEKFIL